MRIITYYTIISKPTQNDQPKMATFGHTNNKVHKSLK